MNKSKLVLGRGLDALIKQSQSNESADDFENLRHEHKTSLGSISKIQLKLISPNPFQPRSSFDPEKMAELKKSIIKNGLIQPITVRRWGTSGYQLISGERRFRACQELEYSDIPAYIIDVVSDEVMLAMALIENLQREQLNPIEIGIAYKRLMDECNLTQEEIAERVGKDRTTVANSVRLLKLPSEIKSKLISGDITMGHARALINLNDQALQISIVNKILKDNLSVRNVEQLVKKFLLEGKKESSVSSLSKKNISSDAGLLDVEDKLRTIFGTKVICRKNSSGGGEITLQFFSLDELDRILELIDEIKR